MSVRKKTLLISAITLIALALTASLSSEIVIMRGFTALEEQKVRENADRVVNALSSDLSGMESSAVDWGGWDDTLFFLQGKLPAYMEENITDSSVGAMRVNFFMLADTSGDVFASTGYDMAAQKLAPLPGSLKDGFPADSPLVKHPDLNTPTSGLLVLPEGPALIASCPITDNAHEVPSHGALITGRFLTAEQLEELSKRTHLSVELHRLDSRDLPRDVREADLALSDPSETLVQPLNSKEIAGYRLLEDMFGQPALILHVTMPREIYMRGQSTIIYSIAALILGILVVGLINFLLLEKAVLSRLGRLSTSVKGIQKSSDSSSRVVVDGQDELGTLAGNINDMLQAITRAESTIRHQAHHDAVTGLPNRVLFAQRLEKALAEGRESGLGVGLLALDLDRFKMVNDTFGHDIGDRLLKQAAARLKRSLRKGDLACRIGGDEFTILLPGVKSVSDAQGVAERVLEAFAHPFVIEGHEMHVSTSIGISIYPADGREPRALLQRADAALYEAKQEGRSMFKLHGAHVEDGALSKLDSENELHRAIEEKQLLIHYQPEVDTTTGRVPVVEALLRWQHPTRGLLEAEEFIAAAEDAGVIETMGRWVLREACAEAKRWQEERVCDPLPRMAVNLSGREFSAADLTAKTNAILKESGLPPDLLELEIGERTVMWNVERSIAKVQELSRHGITVTLDDFGLGHSSLAHLKLLPIHALKIDKSFIHDLEADDGDNAIVEAIIAMGRALGLRVVAEGVETPGQSAFLSAHGCREMQGYLLARPMSAEEIMELLRTQPLVASGLTQTGAPG